MTLHYIALHYNTIQYNTSQNIQLDTLHCIIFERLHYITLSTNWITLHYITLHTLHALRTIQTLHTWHTLHTCIHAYMHTRIHAYSTCACIDTHTCIHAYIQACMHDRAGREKTGQAMTWHDDMTSWQHITRHHEASQDITTHHNTSQHITTHGSCPKYLFPDSPQSLSQSRSNRRTTVSNRWRVCSSLIRSYT